MPSRKPKPAAGGGRPRAAADGSAQPRKLVAFDPAVLDQLMLLGRDRMQSFQELADEAFRDVLNKHGRPVSLKAALRESARTLVANDFNAPAPRRPRTR